MKKLLLLFVALSISVQLSAQHRVTGTVTGSDDQPLAGVSVIEKGTLNGVASDINGKFSLTVQAEATLEFSFIGYKTEEIVLAPSQTTLSVKMVEDFQALDEVVVVGYGTVRKSDLTGSVASVSADDFKSTVITNADQLLQGRVAGVQVTQNSGAPGGAASIRIRGASSINSSNEPLYVIDGIPFSGDGTETGGFSWAGGTGGQTKVNPLSTIAPGDIISMDVLKDASATAIYGAAGANGVVIINTRRGQKGSVRLNYDGHVAWQQFANQIDMMNLQQYAQYQKELNELYPSVEIDESFLEPSLLGAGTNWQDEITRTALTHSHSISFSGGSENFTFAASGGYMSQDGTIHGSNFERYNGRFNGDGTINKWLKAGGSLAFTHTEETITRQDGSDGVIMQALTMQPSVPVYDFDGNFAAPSSIYGSSGYNPLWQAEMQNNTLSRNRTMGNFYLQIDPLKVLNIRAEFGFDLSDNLNQSFIPTYDFGNGVANSMNMMLQREDHSKFWIFKTYATWNQTFKKHNVSLMAGFEAQKSAWEGVSFIKKNFSNDDVHVMTNDGEFDNNSGWKDSATKASVFGRLNYNFDERYLVTFTMRADGSSKFGPEHKWGYFPSAAVAWRISNEAFLRDVDVLSNLKLRLGYGMVGNDNIGTYKYGSKMHTMVTALGTGYFVENISNPNLKWEASEQYNIGIDLGLWNNRLSVTADVYQKDTKDLLLQLSVPSYLGTSGNPDKAGWEIQMPYSNIGKVRNRGVDIAINAVPVETKNFRWTSSVNLSLNRNEVMALNDDAQVLYYGVGTYFSAAFSTASIVKVGQPMGVFYGYTTDGYFANEEDVLSAAVQVEDGNNPGQNLFNKTQGVYVGDIKFRDTNNDGVVDAKDQTVIGDPNPDFTYGWNNSFTYKDFELQIGLTGVQGGDILNIARYRTEALNNQWDNQSVRVIDRAQIGADETGAPYLLNPTTARTPRAAMNDINGNNRMSDRWLEDGSYLRIQNITLGWNVPKRWISKAGFQSLKIYCTLQNLYTWTNYSGYDPEIGAFNQSAAMQNYDMGRYPSPRMYILGVNIGF